jgi:hypothetical protein
MRRSVMMRKCISPYAKYVTGGLRDFQQRDTFPYTQYVTGNLRDVQQRDAFSVVISVVNEKMKEKKERIVKILKQIHCVQNYFQFRAPGATVDSLRSRLSASTVIYVAIRYTL